MESKKKYLICKDMYYHFSFFSCKDAILNIHKTYKLKVFLKQHTINVLVSSLTLGACNFFNFFL